MKHLGTRTALALSGAILATIGSWLMAGAFLAIGSCMSAASSNLVFAFILSCVVCFLFIVAGFPLVIDAFEGWLPNALTDAVAALSVLTHFQAISKGVLELRDLAYFVILIGGWLAATTVVIDLRRMG